MARHLPEGAERSRQILALLLALGEARRLTSGQLVEALATCKEAAEIARAEGAPADLARAAERMNGGAPQDTRAAEVLGSGRAKAR